MRHGRGAGGQVTVRLPENEMKPRRRQQTREERENEKFVTHQMMYLLTAPIMGMPKWVDTLRMHKEEITIQRLAQHKEIFEAQECTEFEAMLYISKASLEFPLGHDWTEVYTYLLRRWSPEKAKAVDIEGPDKLNQYPQQEHLTRLRKWIYQTQMKHLQSQFQETDQAEVKKEAEGLREEQQRLF